MPIAHPPIDISFVRRRQSLTCRRLDFSSPQGEALSENLPRIERVTPVSRISSGRNRTDAAHNAVQAKSDTLFTAFPVELRVEVFLQFCGMYPPVNKDKGPLMLLQVCRAWRQLTLQTPQLWRSFALQIGPRLTGPEHSEFLVSTIEGWIERSRNLPLSFELHYKPDRSTAKPVFDATYTNLIRTILPSSARWRDVALSAPTTCLSPLLEVSPDSFSGIRSLRVETAGPWGSLFGLNSLGFNWAQLRELDLFLIATPTLDECLHILKEGVNLTRCTMNAICVFTASAPERVALPKLRHFSLTLYGRTSSVLPQDQPESHLLSFLNTLCLPGLESLQLSWNATSGPNQGYYWSDFFTEFLTFLEQLGPSLTALHLFYLPFSVAQVLKCLRVLPSLRHLDLRLPQSDREHDFVNDEFLGALAQEPGLSEIVPVLQSIRLESRGESFTNSALLGFIASRWRHQGPPTNGALECFELVSPKRCVEYRPQMLRDWEEGRLDVAAGLKCECKMVDVLSSFLGRASYGRRTCFLNSGFSSDIRHFLALH